MTADWKKKKVAIYLRSKGDTGDTESQLDRIEPLIQALEKAKKIKKVNRKIVGRQFNYTKTEGRFKASRDLARTETYSTKATDNQRSIQRGRESFSGSC